MRSFLILLSLPILVGGCFTFISFDEAAGGGGQTTNASTALSTGGSATGGSDVGGGGSGASGGGGGGGIVCPPDTLGQCANPTAWPCTVGSTRFLIGDLESGPCHVAYAAVLNSGEPNRTSACVFPQGADAGSGLCSEVSDDAAQGSIAVDAQGVAYYAPPNVPSGSSYVRRCTATGCAADWGPLSTGNNHLNGLLILPDESLVAFDANNVMGQVVSVDLATGEMIYDVITGLPDGRDIRRAGDALLFAKAGGADKGTETQLSQVSAVQSAVQNQSPLPLNWSAGTDLGELIGATMLPDQQSWLVRAYQTDNQTHLLGNLPVSFGLGNCTGRCPGLASDDSGVYFFDTSNGNHQLKRCDQSLGTCNVLTGCPTGLQSGAIALTKDWVFFSCGIVASHQLYRIPKQP